LRKIKAGKITGTFQEGEEVFGSLESWGRTSEAELGYDRKTIGVQDRE